jgi:phage terminase small subunit
VEKEKLDRIEELEKMLTPKERQFIEELEFDGNKGEAALRAGFGKGENIRSAGTAASRILAKEEVRELRALRAERAYEELGLSRDTIIAEVVKVYRRCMSGEEVMRWDKEKKMWVGTGEWQFDSKGALKALELMGEPIGVFKNDENGKDQSIDVNINVVDKIEK